MIGAIKPSLHPFTLKPVPILPSKRVSFVSVNVVIFVVFAAVPDASLTSSKPNFAQKEKQKEIYFPSFLNEPNVLRVSGKNDLESRET